MIQRPLVTIITPCFNDNDTLGMALASLQAQTMPDWECIVIDDGSGDPVRPLAEAFGDTRIRLRTFRSNQGRPVARQAALEMARGKYICMLDADDWYYPDKLEHQLEIMERYPGLAAVSMALAVVDGQGDLTGIRCSEGPELEIRVGDGCRPPKIAFPPVMLRRRIANGHRFDPRLQRTQDADYLMRALAEEPFGVMRQVGYAYCDSWSPRAAEEALAAFRYQRMTCARDCRRAPVAMTGQFVESLLKTGVYRALTTIGCGRWLFERRNRAPTAEERLTFIESHRIVGHNIVLPTPTHRIVYT